MISQVLRFYLHQCGIMIDHFVVPAKTDQRAGAGFHPSSALKARAWVGAIGVSALYGDGGADSVYAD